MSEETIFRSLLLFNKEIVMTYAEIGLILGISRSRVKQIETRALEKLRVYKFLRGSYD